MCTRATGIPQWTVRTQVLLQRCIKWWSSTDVNLSTRIFNHMPRVRCYSTCAHLPCPENLLPNARERNVDGSVVGECTSTHHLQCHQSAPTHFSPQTTAISGILCEPTLSSILSTCGHCICLSLGTCTFTIHTRLAPVHVVPHAARSMIALALSCMRADRWSVYRLCTSIRMNSELHGLPQN